MGLYYFINGWVVLLYAVRLRDYFWLHFMHTVYVDELRRLVNWILDCYFHSICWWALVDFVVILGIPQVDHWDVSKTLLYTCIGPYALHHLALYVCFWLIWIVCRIFNYYFIIFTVSSGVYGSNQLLNHSVSTFMPVLFI